MNKPDFIDENNYKEFDYVTYPRQFDSYRWWKPILTIILFVVFFVILDVLLTIATGVFDFIRTDGDLNGFIARLQSIAEGGYDEMSVYDVTGCLVILGGIATMIPALAMARGIVRDRSFASYSSSRGGWSHTVFFKSFIIALIICGGTLYLYYFGIGKPGPYNNQFTKSGLIALCILCPLQCLAEEYIFRGLLTQTLGAWFRIPEIALAISSIGFAALHPYNTEGQIAILCSGLGMGLAAWIGHGIEVSAALHIVNNMAAFLMDGFGYSGVASTISAGDMAVDIGINIAYVLVILFLSKKTDWFDRLKYNDAGDWNILLDDKRKRKEAKKAAKQAKRDAKKAKKEE